MQFLKKYNVRFLMAALKALFFALKRLFFLLNLEISTEMDFVVINFIQRKTQFLFSKKSI